MSITQVSRSTRATQTELETQTTGLHCLWTIVEVTIQSTHYCSLLKQPITTSTICPQHRHTYTQPICVVHFYKELVFTAPFCNTLPSLEDGRHVNQGRAGSVPFILPPGSPLVSTYQDTFSIHSGIHLPIFTPASPSGFLLGSISPFIAIGLSSQSFGWFISCWAKLGWSLLPCSVTSRLYLFNQNLGAGESIDPESRAVQFSFGIKRAQNWVGCLLYSAKGIIQSNLN